MQDCNSPEASLAEAQKRWKRRKTVFSNR